MSDKTLTNSEIILYRTEDGRTRVQFRIWAIEAIEQVKQLENGKRAKKKKP